MALYCNKHENSFAISLSQRTETLFNHSFNKHTENIKNMIYLNHRKNILNIGIEGNNIESLYTLFYNFPTDKIINIYIIDNDTYWLCKDSLIYPKDGTLHQITQLLSYINVEYKKYHYITIINQPCVKLDVLFSLNRSVYFEILAHQMLNGEGIVYAANHYQWESYILNKPINLDEYYTVLSDLNTQLQQHLIKIHCSDDWINIDDKKTMLKGNEVYTFDHLIRTNDDVIHVYVDDTYRLLEEKIRLCKEQAIILIIAEKKYMLMYQKHEINKYYDYLIDTYDYLYKIKDVLRDRAYSYWYK